MKKEQKLEPQQNSDSTAHIQQVSPTCPKPIVMRRIGVCYIATHYLDEDDSKVFMKKEDAILFCTKQDRNYRWVARDLYGA